MGNKTAIFVGMSLLLVATVAGYLSWRALPERDALILPDPPLDLAPPTFEKQLPPGTYPECERRLRNSLRGWIYKGGMKPNAQGWRDGMTEAIMIYHDCEKRDD